ncbi:MAG: substrate-binding domain-containing protein [Pseudomonadota bacterium]
MMKLCLTAALLLSFMLSAPGRADAVRLSGSTTVANAIILPMRDRIEADAQAQLHVVQNGSLFGIVDLVEGRSDIAMISAPLDLTLAKLGAASPRLLDRADLRAHRVGETQAAFIVHPSSPLRALALAQIARLLDGTVTNWSEVGGADRPVIIVAERPGGGLRTLAEERLVDAASIGGTLREFVNATQVPIVVSQLPGALGIAAPKASARAAVRILETDEAIAQPLILVTSGEPNEAIRAVIEAVQAAGR